MHSVKLGAHSLNIGHIVITSTREKHPCLLSVVPTPRSHHSMTDSQSSRHQDRFPCYVQMLLASGRSSYKASIQTPYSKATKQAQRGLNTQAPESPKDTPNVGSDTAAPGRLRGPWHLPGRWSGPARRA